MLCFILFKYRKQKFCHLQIFLGHRQKGSNENFRKGLIAQFWRFFKREYFYGTLSRKEVWSERPNLVKFRKENEASTPVLGGQTASCGMKLLRILKHYSESLFSTTLGTVSKKCFSLHTGKCYWSFCFASCYFHALLAALSFN